MLNNEEIKCSLTEIPFKTSLSFEYLIDELIKISGDKDHPLMDSASKTLQEVEKVPELKKTIKDYSVIKENRKLVNKLMAFVFSPSKWDIEMSAASSPFASQTFFSTNLFDSTLKGDHRKLQMARDFENENVIVVIIYQAYITILKKFYNVEINMDIPFIFKLTDETDNSIKYFKMLVDSTYTFIKVKGKPVKLSQQDIKDLFDHAADLDYWNEKIPLNKFEFSGFLQFSYIDITQEYLISQLKSDLLDKNAVITLDGFNKIKEKVIALVGLSDLEFGLAAASDFDSSINQNMIWRTIIPQSELTCQDYKDTIYETAYSEKKIVLTDDFKNLEKDKVVSAFLSKGYRSHAIVPLMIDDEIVGLMEFSSKKVGWLSLIQINRFQELFPVFALSLKRSKEEWVDKIRAIIQEEFTAIHPTVEWRFRDAVSNMLADKKIGDKNVVEPIIFNDVVPVYGAADIRNSSMERNKAIQADLTEHFSLIKGILVQGMHNKEMPLLNNLAFKIEQNMHKVGSGLKAGDEVSIIDFFKKEVDPLFHQLRLRDESMVDTIDNYFDQMDPELGVLYHRRKDFEDSLMRINDVIGDFLDNEQVKAQRVFPHYFEKYRTDGVEYNAYLGQSLVKDLKYDEIYLKNIRLWQLLTMVSVARKIRHIQPELKTKLDVTQLILVQSNPLSIAFRQDEKKFDVAGAYNIRYEITKKRIDKAVVKGSRERITQVGKIAIIYSIADEIDEYKGYIDYLIAQGHIKNNIEYLELEDLQGASGLRAVRVEVDFTMSAFLDEIDFSEIEKIIGGN